MSIENEGATWIKPEILHFNSMSACLSPQPVILVHVNPLVNSKFLPMLKVNTQLRLKYNSPKSDHNTDRCCIYNMKANMERERGKCVMQQTHYIRYLSVKIQLFVKNSADGKGIQHVVLLFPFPPDMVISIFTHLKLPTI